MNNGWIKLHRSLLDWEWWDNINARVLWITILLSVNHEPKRWRGMEVGAGEMVTSYRKLARLSGLSVRSVRSALADIVSTHEVTLTSTHKCTIIKVVKWAEYQGYDDQTDTPTDTEVVSKTTTNKNKEYKKKEKRINTFRKPTLDEIRSYIKNNNLNVDADYFYDYYESNGWKVGGKTSMKSWESTLKNWSRREGKKPGHVVIDPPDYFRTSTQKEYDPEEFKW